MIITTACSTGWYPRLVSLIGSIHHTNYDNVTAILVYDVGLKPQEHAHIARMDKVQMRQVPWVNPYVLTPFRARECGDPYPYVGLMTWKPAALYQTLLEHDTALWMDAGTTAWGKLDKLWEHIQHEGYFFIGYNDLNQWTTTYVKERLQVEPYILESDGINAGTFGFSRRISSTIISPCYEWAKDINLFVDDGTAAGGLTAGHEQTLLGILAARANLNRPVGCDRTLYDGTRIRITCNPEELNHETVIYHSRGDGRFGNDTYIRYSAPEYKLRGTLWKSN